jgi:hypothetical protein
MYIFGQAIVTRAYLHDAIKEGTPWSEVVTPSDEAFIITVMLNFWNVWVDQDHKIPSNLRAAFSGQPHVISALPKYIIDGDWPQDKPKWSKQGRGEGWSAGAIDCYLHMLELVELDRADESKNTDFDARMRTILIRGMSKSAQAVINKKRKLVPETNDTNKQTKSKMHAAMKNLD